MERFRKIDGCNIVPMPIDVAVLLLGERCNSFLSLTYSALMNCNVIELYEADVNIQSIMLCTLKFIPLPISSLKKK